MAKVRITPGPLARAFPKRTAHHPVPGALHPAVPELRVADVVATRQPVSAGCPVSDCGGADSAASVSCWCRLEEQRLLQHVAEPGEAHPDKADRPDLAGSSSSRWAIAVRVAGSAVAYGSVADRVSVDMSDFFSLTVTVRAPRPSRVSRRWACSAIGQ